MTFSPESDKEVQEVLRERETVKIVGTETKSDFGCPINAKATMSMRAISGISEWSPADLVVSVRAGTRIDELQQELKHKNQCLPIPPFSGDGQFVTAGMPGTVGGLVSANLPTRWDSYSKGVRYWVLGLRVVLSNGVIVKCGSRAVKNVAGYDAQKAFVGAWGSLGVITEATFRVFPIKAYHDEPSSWTPEMPIMVARAPISEAKSNFSHYLDAATGTIWACVDKPIEKPPHGWAFYAGLGSSNFSEFDNVDIMLRLKNKLDPDKRLNPGVLGIF